MWGHMAREGYMMGGFGMFLWLAALIWFVIFTILVISKLNRIIRMLEHK